MEISRPRVSMGRRLALKGSNRGTAPMRSVS